MTLEGILRVVSGLLGGCCLLGLVLIQEDEERGFRNRLVDWWEATTRTSESAGERFTAVARALAGAILKGLDRIFGPKVLSIRFLIGSLFVTHTAFGMLAGAHLLIVARDADALLVIGASLAVGGTLFFRRPLMIALYIACMALLLFVQQDSSSLVGPFLLISIVAGIVFNAIYLPAVKAILRWALRPGSRAWQAALLFVPSLGIAALPSCIPESWFGQDLMFGYMVLSATGIPAVDEVILIVMVVLVSIAIVNLLLSGGIALFVIVMGANVVGWNSISRLLGNLHDRGPSRKHVLWFGMTLLGLAISPTSDWIAKQTGLPIPTTQSKAPTRVQAQTAE